MAELKHGSDYHTAFDPKSYLNIFYKTHKGKENQKGLLEESLKDYHKFWSDFNSLPISSKDPIGVRCLEYGGGPCLAGLISASPKVDRIVFADYTEANRKAVMSWIAESHEAHDWSPLIEFVVRDLEHDNVSQAVSNRAADMKRKIQSVVHCDVKRNPIVDLESVDVGKPFDVVSTSFCLAACVNSEEEYKSAVAKLCKLLKPSGYLLMHGRLNESFYTVGDEKFQAFPLTQTTIEAAMKAGGIEDINFELPEADLPSNPASGQFVYFVLGRKSSTAT